METNSDDEFFDCEYEPVKYYAVACQKDKGKGLVTIDINEARTKLKNCRGSRFCSFYDPLEAKKFSEKPLVDDSESAAKKKTISEKKISDPFPNASQIDLNRLKSSIKQGALDKVKELIWNNPRILVTESDSPTRLVPRFRYNALHIAITSNQPQILKFIVDALAEISFWVSIYPTADENSNRYRMNRVLDMYLNGPETGNLETPLHLASKFGNVECLRLLLGQELTDVTLKNRSGLKPEEIICQRSPDLSNASKIDEIRQVFSEKFVVLLDGDGGQVLDPMTHCQLLRLLRMNNNIGYRFDNSFGPSTQHDVSHGGIAIDRLGIVRAYIGPLEDIKARQLSYRWAVLNAQDASKFEEIRRSDAEKGMEAHGRYLACEFGAPWRELWQFLDAYVDLGCDDGLQQLEDHLAKQELHISHDNNVSSFVNQSQQSMDAAVNTVNTSNQLSTSGMWTKLTYLFSKMSLHSRTEDIGNASNGNEKIDQSILVSDPIDGIPNGSFQSPISNRSQPVSPPHFHTPIRSKPFDYRSSVITSTPLYKEKSLRMIKTPFNSSLLGEGYLTPTDRHVRRAVVLGRGKTTQFPRVSTWLSNLSELDPDLSLSMCTPNTAHFNGTPLLMSTPIRFNHCNSHFRKPFHAKSFKCLSPLSRIELPD